MKIIEYNVPVVTTQLEEHINIKNNILSLIDKSQGEKIDINNSSVDTSITKSDWYDNFNMDREYFKLLWPALNKCLSKAFEEINYNTFILKNFWYQQYSTGGSHDWHVHLDCQWTGVYYLELPASTPCTLLKSPIDKKIEKLIVQEGDVVFFPSLVNHKAPVNNSNKRKTIISFNMDSNIH